MDNAKHKSGVLIFFIFRKISEDENIIFIRSETDEIYRWELQKISRDQKGP